MIKPRTLKQFVKDKDKAWQELTDRVAKQKALRLAKEAVDKEAADQAATEKASAAAKKEAREKKSRQSQPSAQSDGQNPLSPTTE